MGTWIQRGLVEIDDQGNVIRAGSSANAAFPDTLLSPYGLVVLPELDRVVSTNSSMHLEDIFRGVTYQEWRLSDLKLLKTAYLDPGENHYGQISPEEPRLARMDRSMCKRSAAGSSASQVLKPMSPSRNWYTHSPVTGAVFPPLLGIT